MKWMKVIGAMVGTSLVCMAMLSAAPATSTKPSGITALRGVEAQPMTEAEMKTVSGQLNAYDIAAALTALAAKEGDFPKLQAATLKLASYYLANATTINARYQKLGILTPCKSCTP